jgi:hypothetical protein
LWWNYPVTNLLETPAADAAPGPSAAERAIAELQALAAGVGESLSCKGVRGFDDDGLLQVTAAAEVLGRQVDALRVAAAGEVADRSRPELGLATGAIGVDTAEAILTALTSTLRCTDLVSVRVAESELVAAATGTSGETPVPVPASADEIRLQGAVWKAVLAPDGSRPDDHAMVSRGIRLGRERDGIVPVSGALMPEIAGKLRRLFDAYLSPKSAPPTSGGTTCSP